MTKAPNSPAALLKKTIKMKKLVDIDISGTILRLQNDQSTQFSHEFGCSTIKMTIKMKNLLTGTLVVSYR